MLNRPMTPSVQRAGVGRQAAIDQIGRQVHGDEQELEAAGEESEHQQHVTAVAEGLGQRLHQRLLLRGARRRFGVAPSARASASESGTISRTITLKIKQRVLPAEALRSARPRAARTGTGRTSPPRCRRRRQAIASSPAAACRSARKHERERASGNAEAGDEARRQIEHPRRRRIRHQRETDGVQDRAAAHHQHDAEPVGQRARERQRRRPRSASGSPAPARTRRGPSHWRPTSAEETARARSAARSRRLRSSIRPRGRG